MRACSRAGAGQAYRAAVKSGDKVLVLASGPKEVLAIINARILPVSGKEIAKGTILIEDGKITAVGKDVQVPDGAEVIDANGMTAMPGLVNPYSRLGTTIRGRGTRALPHYLAYDEFNPAVDTFARIARTGYTSFAIYPNHGTISGRAVLVKPVGITKDSMVAEKAVFLRIDMALGTATKKLLKKEFENAKKLLEAAKKKAEEDKKKDAEKKKKPDDKKGAQPPPAKPTKPSKPAQPSKPAKPAKKPDEKSQALMDYLTGKFPAIVEIGSPAELLHFWQCIKGIEDLKPNYAIRTGGSIYKAADKIGARNLTVLLSPSLTFEQYTKNRINTAAEIVKAGGRIVFTPFGDSISGHQQVLYSTGQMVKFGLDRDHALKSITLHAAQVAGVDKRVGSLEKGKDADILLLSGDPFDPMSHVEKVIINGKVVHERSHP